jgi:tripartite-type tricarboxylate transporter receptor subunit TctC
MPLITHIIPTFLVLIASCLLSSAAKAQSFPNRPITVNVSFAPGAPQDLVMRAIAEIASKDLGQPIIIDNKPGAAATLAAAVTMAAKPDGYTLATAVSTIVLVPQMQRVAFDPFKDFTYIQQFAAFPVGVTVKTDSPFKSWADVIAHAKANPGVVTYGTPGPGTNVHLGMERVQRHAGIKLTHVPHTGAVALIPAVLGGHIMLQASGMEWKPSVDAGQMRVLIMGTPTRHPSYPDVPTLREVGFPFDIEVPFGLVGPNGIDSVIVARLHDAFKKANETPSVVSLYAKFDIIPRYATGHDFRKLFETIHVGMKPVIEGLGLQRKE